MSKDELVFPFTDAGLLPPGDIEITLRDLMESSFVGGCGSSSTWDMPWRKKLVENLSVMVGQLFQVGIRNIFVNGSFVEDKDHPNDVDGYFECELPYLASGELQRDLNLLDPHKVWTWAPESRKPYRGYPKRQLPMWHVYRVELYPHYGQLSGIRDRFGHELEFPSAFRQSRSDGSEKGMLKILPEGE